MNEKLPKPMDDALRTQAPPKEHPSADLLVAYMEQSLPEAERHSVVSHLAQCGDCRQVLYLASGATEDSLAQQEAVIAAKKGRRWLPRLVWVGTAAAGLLLVGGYFVRDRMASQRHETLAASNQAVMRSESQPAQPQTQPQEASPLQGASNTTCELAGKEDDSCRDGGIGAAATGIKSDRGSGRIGAGSGSGCLPARATSARR